MYRRFVEHGCRYILPDEETGELVECHWPANIRLEKLDDNGKPTGRYNSYEIDGKLRYRTHDNGVLVNYMPGGRGIVIVKNADITTYTMHDTVAAARAYAATLNK